MAKSNRIWIQISADTTVNAHGLRHETLMAYGSERLKLIVKRAADYQSTAAAYIWHPEAREWKAVCAIPFEKMICRKFAPSGNHNLPTEWFIHDVVELKTRVQAVLGGEAQQS